MSRVVAAYVDSPLTVHGTDWPVQMIEISRNEVTWNNFQINRGLWVDPVHLFLSLSSETVFEFRPLPTAVSAVAGNCF